MEENQNEQPKWRRGLVNLANALLPEMNFITIHYAYFIFTSLISAVIFWASSTPFQSVSFTDSLFLCASAMTEAGLNTVNLSTLNTWQQTMLFLLIVIGSAIFVSIFVLYVRLHAFHREFRRTIAAARDRRQQNRARSREASSRRRRTDSFRSEIPSGPSARSPFRSSAATLRASGNADEMAQISKQPSASQPLDALSKASRDLSDAMREVSDPQGQHVETRDSPPVFLAEKPASPDQLSEESQLPSGEAADQALAATDNRDTFRTFDRSIHFDPYLHHRGRPSEDISNLSTLHRPITGNSHRSHYLVSQAENNHPSIFSFTGVGAIASSSLEPRSPSRGAFESPGPAVHFASADEKPARQWLPSATGYFTRNSSVYGLTFEERQELGGREYYAIFFLSIIVPLYFVLFQFLGAIAIGAWTANHRASTARENGISPWWVGSFNAISAFNNSGMSLLDANMTAFQDAIFMLLSMGLFILAGNTAYPIFLRSIVWGLWSVLPEGEYWQHEKETLRFLLDHPRRCYTNLFPARHTWWLGLSLITLNGIDWAMFEILNIGNAAITQLRDGVEALDGLFQALAVRSGGFYVVPIASTRISLQVLYVIMMFISAYPVAMTMRNSNVYEERSLGIFSEDIRQQREQADESKSVGGAADGPKSREGFLGRLRWMTQARTREQTTAFLRQQLRAQLSHDAWWLALAVFLISIIENSSFEADPKNFSLFNILFEVVSGYACCGISVGIPWEAYSFCGTWHVLSKLIMVAVMIRGRHRGLPVAIDSAVQLPGRRVWEAEEEDGRTRLERSMTANDVV